MASIAARAVHMANPRLLLLLALALGVLAAQAGGGTLAYFTSTATSTGNLFTAGTVTINLADFNEPAATSVTASITAGNTTFQPGQTAVGFITTSNAGTLPFDYGLKYTATNGGTSLITGTADPALELYAAGVTGNCTVANANGALTGLTSLIGPTALSTTADTLLLDSGGASKRPLLAGATDFPLCFVVRWANGIAGAENAKQGASATVVFNYDARQQ